jgi:hypothetical protein
LIDTIKSIEQNYKWIIYRLCFESYQNKYEIINTETADQNILDSDFCARMDEHVPNIKRYICMVKECTRSRYNSLPFEWILHLMLIWLTANTVFWLNAFPCSNGVSDTLSLRYLTTGKHLDYQKHVHHDFSIYIQTHKSHTNDM